ncbi:MAG TPA: DUF1152 domain-containing protein [Solirubrobacteraceae bacterium]|nr:DUF1152 domain-containing protein [Solirubrobacteraceae bacterium]
MRSLQGAGRVLCVGIGGGGDVVGALAAAQYVRSLGAEAIVGGLTWERRPIDPEPGPRRLDEIVNAEVLNEAVALAGPDTVTASSGIAFAESHMAGHLGERTVLVDPNPGPARVGRGLSDAARRLGCDAIVLLDVGGDALAHGDEPGLASPLADAILLAAARHIDPELRVVAAVFGAGCDGELTPAEVLDRIAEIAARGGWLGAYGLGPDEASLLEAAIEVVPTEASAMAVRCARGARGGTTIRRGRRKVELSPVGSLTFLLDPHVAMDSAARLADAVTDADSLRDANAILHRLGVRSELDYELEMAAAPRN